MKNFRMLALGLLFGLYGSGHFKPAPALQLSFEENHGQAPSSARFLARGRGYNIALTPEGNHVVLRHAGHAVSVKTSLVDANPGAAIRGEEKLIGKVHYLRGSGSLTDIPTYARVRYQGVYPGIDLVYYGNEAQLEYDFVVDPGADPNRIELRFEGADALTIDGEGNLVLRANDSEIVQHKPLVYQRVNNSRREVQGAYRLMAGNTVAFDVGPYDHNTALVIDPILSYSTFFGGSNGDDDARAVSTDSAGNLYITGSTTSTNFQTVFAFQPNSATQDPTAGLSDAFVTKLNPSGTALIYSTYFGGVGDDDANAIAVDFSGNAVVVGSTTSQDFPAFRGIQRICKTGATGCLDAFVVKLNAAGSDVIFATYFGGTGDDVARGVAVDFFGSVYITGKTDSTDLPTTFGAYSTDPLAGGFVTKLDPSGSITYCTYLGTIFGPTDPKAIGVDPSGFAYITGSLAIPGSATGTDLFIAKLAPVGTNISFLQTVRGSKDDVANSLVVDSSGSVYIAGETSSTDFPTTSLVVQPAYGGGPAFRSSDGGSTWSPGRKGITRTSLYALAVVPGAPNSAYVGADDETVGGVFKTSDGGETWTGVSAGLRDSRVHALAVDPTSTSTVYAGTRTVGVFKSTNGGSTWVGTGLNNVFVTALAVDPGGATIYAGTDANGIYKSQNGGTTWSAINNGLVATSIRAILIDPSVSTTIYAATSAGVYKSPNSGDTWVSSSSGLLDPNVNSIAVDPKNPSVLYAGTNSTGVFRTGNGGGLWVAANGGLTGSGGKLSVTALAIDAVSGTVYAGIGQSNVMRLYKSSNGTTWSTTSLATTRLTALGTAPTATGTVYVATVGGSDAFVMKLNASGSLVYSTYLGGYRDDKATGIAIDSNGGVYITGSTSSENFPIANAVQTAFSGGSDVVTDAFAAKLSASATELTYSTYLGGTSNDSGNAITVDPGNAAYVVGTTFSGDFPVTNGLIGVRPGLQDAFIVKIAEGSAISFAVPTRGGFSASSQGASTITSVGYVRIQPSSGGAIASGLAIFGYRKNNVLVSETAVPASRAISTGRIYAEAGNNVNTGIAIANPNLTSTTITYYSTDSSGQSIGDGTFTIPANGQIAKFLNEPPFFGSASLLGAFTFTATQPVAVIALRGLTNERGDFLITTLPVADLSVSTAADAVLFPQFADGGGWTTQILLTNTTDTLMSGSVQFAGLPSQDYSIQPRSATKVATSGASTGVLTGAARVIPSPGYPTPTGVAVFSYKNAGVTVTEAGIPALRPGKAFRLYAESSGSPGQKGSIQTGIAFANPSETATSVTFEITTITGVSTGVVGTVALPGNGQGSLFLDQIPGFTGLPNPFQGVLRVSTQSAAGISIVGLRARYNERGDFLITTTPPSNEAQPILNAEQFFPHFVDGAGYTTQFILFNGTSDQPASGLIRFFGQGGQTLDLGVR